jgi:8-hydroxy-5-deazaflavin:NADPH oxidoreductase
MKVGIIGAGNIGSALARRLTTIGHEVSIANSRGPETLQDLVAETGAHAVPASEAAKDADIVIVTIPQNNIPDLPAGLLDGAAAGAAFVDTGNYYPRHRDGRIDAIETGTPETLWVQGQLGRPMVKAFNSIVAPHLRDLGKPAGTPGRIALPVAGDDSAAKAKVSALIEQLGFDVVDAGGLSESWRQQPGSPVYLADLDTEGVRNALAAATSDRPEEFRATASSPGTYADPA